MTLYLSSNHWSSTMLAIRLPADIEARLDRLAKATGRTKTFYAREAILDHLDELRTRLIRSFLALAVGFMACFGFIEPIFDFIMVPMTAVLQEGATLLQRPVAS